VELLVGVQVLKQEDAAADVCVVAAETAGEGGLVSEKTREVADVRAGAEGGDIRVKILSEEGGDSDVEGACVEELVTQSHPVIVRDMDLLQAHLQV
jgi:hypothetical protein